MEKLQVFIKERENRYFILLLFLLMFLSKGYHYASIVLGVIAVFYLVDSRLKEKFKRIDLKIYLPFLLVFFLQLVGFIRTENMNKAWQEVIVRLSFVLLPAIILSESLSKEKLYKLLVWLKYYLLGFALFLIVYQFYIHKRLWTLSFFALKQITDIHHMYFSQFYMLLLLFVIYQMKRAKINIVLGIFQIGAILFFLWVLGAVPSMLFSILFVLIALFKEIKSGLFKTTILLVIVSGIFMVRNTLLVKHKYDKITQLEYNIDKNIEKYHKLSGKKFGASNSLEMRMIKWYVAWDIIKNNFWTGVGTGDYQDELNKGYKKIHFANGIKFEFNTHNQFLEEGIKLGVVGILSLLFFFGSHLFWSFKQSNWMLFGMILYIISIAIIESLFERFHGVAFYSIVIPLLYVFCKKSGDEA